MRRAVAVVLALLACVSGARAAEEAVEKPGWDAFDLKTRTVDGIVIHYEASLEPAMDDVEKLFRAELEKIAALDKAAFSLDRFHESAVEICRIVALPQDHPAAVGATKSVQSLFAHWPFRSLLMGKGGEIYVVRRDTTKDYLRAGGALPGFTYDKEHDIAQYRFGVYASVDSSGETITNVAPLALPVKGADTMVEELQEFLSMGRPSLYFAVGFHEIAEMMIAARLASGDPHLRWFQEGFANVVSFYLLERLFGEGGPDDFRAQNDAAPYGDMENTVNLEYWLAAAFDVNTPLDSESVLSNARYAYATVEAKHLVDEHGIECLKAILDRCAEKKPLKSEGLFEAIREVTGEDLKERFAQYRSFDTAEEGIKMYSERYEEALKEKDYTTMLPNILRLMELKGGYDVDFYRRIALILLKMGYEDYADQMYYSQLAWLKKAAPEPVYMGLALGFVDHALKCGKPAKAYKIAEELIAFDADCVLALCVRLHRLAAEKRFDEAQQTAEHVLELDANPESPAHKDAAGFIEWLEARRASEKEGVGTGSQ